VHQLCVLVILDAQNLRLNALHEHVELVIQRRFRATHFSVCVAVEANEDELGTLWHKDIVIADLLVLLVVACMCVFVCFDCNGGSVDEFTMVDATAMVTTATCIHPLVVHEAVETSIYPLAHHCLAPLQTTTLGTSGVVREYVDEAVCAMLVVFCITPEETTCNTKARTPVLCAQMFVLQTRRGTEA